MNIGEKIKNLRTSKLMTQKELAGTAITRNMLSRIENGAAMPSLQTLIYIAERLGVPAGYLLSDKDENDNYYRKYVNYSNIIEAFRSGEWAICRDLCRTCLSEKSDNELTYMFAYSSMQIGIAEFSEGRLHRAAVSFEEAAEYSAKTVFETDAMRSCMRSYRSIMARISLTLNFDIPQTDKTNLYICTNDVCRFERILSGSEIPGTSKIPWENPCYEYALNAMQLSEEKNYDAAISLYIHICDDDTLPRPIIYLILGDYEKCCKEAGDYKDAYEISKNSTRLFEKMLADD
ncbi:MAG: helix-turn-helix domain-containing protein [Eubacteriales bacterium]